MTVSISFFGKTTPHWYLGVLSGTALWQRCVPASTVRQISDKVVLQCLSQRAAKHNTVTDVTKCQDFMTKRHFTTEVTTSLQRSEFKLLAQGF